MTHLLHRYLPVLALATLLCLKAFPSAADLSSEEVNKATERSAAILSQVKVVLVPRVRNYQSLSEVDTANSGIDKCVATYAPKNLGDLSERELEELRECVAVVLQALVDKMQQMKTLQGNAAFEYAVLGEAARLIANERVPARKAMEKVMAMLERSQAAATDASQRLFLDRLNDFTQDIVVKLSP